MSTIMRTADMTHHHKKQMLSAEDMNMTCHEERQSIAGRHPFTLSFSTHRSHLNVSVRLDCRPVTLSVSHHCWPFQLSQKTS